MEEDLPFPSLLDYFESNFYRMIRIGSKLCFFLISLIFFYLNLDLVREFFPVTRFKVPFIDVAHLLTEDILPPIFADPCPDGITADEIGPSSVTKELRTPVNDRTKPLHPSGTRILFENLGSQRSSTRP